ncbi:discoidin, CUB and LCCL domain-containing protein 2 [Carcharodon carcharias]|uniref:discoidin, CUB and LCCL domain-containing protein 2 n=1 Tax=Carcharodon carcharias TaxID=13397 RepID=UPI001B7F3D63|nr:discoidin, CUB and LCCL domain-containing protein 2 [Carcharodon carcharias]
MEAGTLRGKHIRKLGIFFYLIATFSSAIGQKGDGCGHTVLGPESGTFASINYPQTYPNNTVCEWEIRVQPSQRIIFKFGDFDIEDSTSCHLSYLRLYNGIGPGRSEIGKYCGLGIQWDKVIETESNEATVQFMSGTHVSGRGFLVSYSTSNESDLITCLDKGSHFTEPEFSKYCPAGCLTPFGDISGTIPHGYRDSSLLCMAGVHAGVVSNFLGGRINVVMSKGIPYYESTLANNVSSKLGPLSASLFTFKTNGCYGTLGMESGVIGDSQINASSVLQWHDPSGQFHIWGPEKARLKKPGSPWAAFHTDEPQWLQIDLKKEKKITGIITTGSTLGEYSFYVSAYRILSRHDGQDWKVYKEANSDLDMIFQGNSNNYQEVRNNFIPPILARYIQINPVQWHQKAALKVELLGCQPYQLSLARTPSQSLPPLLSTEIPPKFDEITFTPEIKNNSVTPKVTKDVALAAVLVPVLVMVLTTLILVLVCGWHWRNRKKPVAGPYNLPYWDRAGWWKGMKQFLPAKNTEPDDTSVRYSSSEMSRLRARNASTVIQTEPSEYAQPLVAGAAGTLRQGSTFKPEEDSEAGYSDPDGNAHYDAPVSEIYHAYAEPLPVSSPEYATPIIMEISSHPAGTLGSAAASTFKSAGSTGPSVTGNLSTLLPRTEGTSAGQVGYDTPKGTAVPMPAEELGYQVPISVPQIAATSDAE